MPRIEPIHPESLIPDKVIQGATRGEIVHLEVLRRIILASPRSVTPEVVDILFGNLAARPVPPSLRLNLHFANVAFSALAPALCLSLFWNVTQNDQSMTPQVKDAVGRNLVEYGSVLCRWVRYCLRTGHPCLPTEELGDNSSKEEQDRYPAQARLLLHLLRLDATSSQALLSSNAFIELFLELWSGEYERYGGRIFRAMDLSTEAPCPIVLLAATVITNGLSREIFLQRFCSKRACDEFTSALVDRATWDRDDSRICSIAGLAKSLVILFRMTKILWYSNDGYRIRLRKSGFLANLCGGWGTVSFYSTEKN
ncbi:hypothetical protein NMY22_g4547 [Coprinellus aureogranulatus]|nr:hypothetical protein NMY22_g4547 [Coprinellus aureogranulatus]